MAPLPPATKTVRVALTGSIAASGPWVTRFFMQYSGASPTSTQLGTWATSIANAWTARMAPLADITCLLTNVTCQDLTSDTGAVGVANVSMAGTRAGSPPPASTATVISYQIARHYRGGHPRAYWRLGVVADFVNARDWSAAFLTSTGTAIGQFFADIATSGWSGFGTLQQVNVSYYHQPSPPPSGPPPFPSVPRLTPQIDPVVTRVVRTSLGSQRRRLEYNG